MLCSSCKISRYEDVEAMQGRSMQALLLHISICVWLLGDAGCTPPKTKLSLPEFTRSVDPQATIGKHSRATGESTSQWMTGTRSSGTVEKGSEQDKLHSAPQNQRLLGANAMGMGTGGSTTSNRNTLQSSPLSEKAAPRLLENSAGPWSPGLHLPGITQTNSQTTQLQAWAPEGTVMTQIGPDGLNMVTRKNTIVHVPHVAYVPVTVLQPHLVLVPHLASSVTSEFIPYDYRTASYETGASSLSAGAIPFERPRSKSNDFPSAAQIRSGAEVTPQAVLPTLPSEASFNKQPSPLKSDHSDRNSHLGTRGSNEEQHKMIKQLPTIQQTQSFVSLARERKLVSKTTTQNRKDSQELKVDAEKLHSPVLEVVPKSSEGNSHFRNLRFRENNISIKPELTPKKEFDAEKKKIKVEQKEKGKLGADGLGTAIISEIHQEKLSVIADTERRVGKVCVDMEGKDNGMKHAISSEKINHAKELHLSQAINLGGVQGVKVNCHVENVSLVKDKPLSFESSLPLNTLQTEGKRRGKKGKKNTALSGNLNPQGISAGANTENQDDIQGKKNRIDAESARMRGQNEEKNNEEQPLAHDTRSTEQDEIGGTPVRQTLKATSETVEPSLKDEKIDSPVPTELDTVDNNKNKDSPIPWGELDTLDEKKKDSSELVKLVDSEFQEAMQQSQTTPLLKEQESSPQTSEQLRPPRSSSNKISSTRQGKTKSEKSKRKGLVEKSPIPLMLTTESQDVDQVEETAPDTDRERLAIFEEMNKLKEPNYHLRDRAFKRMMHSAFASEALEKNKDLYSIVMREKSTYFIEEEEGKFFSKEIGFVFRKEHGIQVNSEALKSVFLKMVENHLDPIKDENYRSLPEMDYHFYKKLQLLWYIDQNQFYEIPKIVQSPISRPEIYRRLQTFQNQIFHHTIVENWRIIKKHVLGNGIFTEDVVKAIEEDYQLSTYIPGIQDYSVSVLGETCLDMTNPENEKSIKNLIKVTLGEIEANDRFLLRDKLDTLGNGRYPKWWKSETLQEYTKKKGLNLSDTLNISQLLILSRRAHVHTKMASVPANRRIETLACLLWSHRDRTMVRWHESPIRHWLVEYFGSIYESQLKTLCDASSRIAPGIDEKTQHQASSSSGFNLKQLLASNLGKQVFLHDCGLNLMILELFIRLQTVEGRKFDAKPNRSTIKKLAENSNWSLIDADLSANLDEARRKWIIKLICWSKNIA